MQFTHNADYALAQARAVPIEDEISRRGIRLTGRGADRYGPCPVCGGTDRFSINTRKGVFHCRRCGVGGDVIALVRHLDGCDFPTAVGILNGEAVGVRRRPSISPEDLRHQREQRERKSREHEERQTAVALAIWDAAVDWRGTPGEEYLRNCEIDVAEIPRHADIRWHASCPWQKRVMPCLVARLTDAKTAEPKAIQRIGALDSNNTEKLSLGPTAGCVVRLWPDEEVAQGLVIGEGVKTTLAAATRVHFRGTLLRPAWATCGSSNLANFPILAGIDCLTILTDHDDAGIKAAAECAQRWNKAGREIFRLKSPIPNFDFADIAKEISK